jgi:hypothetical protein
VFTFAVIGDSPFGEAQIAEFPGRSEQINAHRQSNWRPPGGHQERVAAVHR